MLSYAASAFCSAMMVITVKLAGNAGLSTFEVLLARSLFLFAVSMVEIIRAGERPLGERCEFKSPKRFTLVVAYACTLGLLTACRLHSYMWCNVCIHLYIRTGHFSAPK